MTTSTKDTESKTDSTNSGYESTDEIKKVDDTEIEDKTDEFGYEKEEDKKPEDDSKKPEEDKKEDDKTEEEEEKSSTGYGEEESEEDKKPNDEVEKEDDKTEDKTDEEKLKVELTETLKGLPEGYDKDKVLKFAQDNKFTNDQVKAYVAMEKTASSEHEESQRSAVITQRKEWTDELKNDVNFGGENFARNIKKVDAILNTHMVNFKKTLTNRGGIVPPYIMKDLLALDSVLNPTTALVDGESPTPPDDKGRSFLDDMYE